MTRTGFEIHDHTRCIADTMAAAEAHCAREKLKFTPVRRRVLELLLRDHKALGAYDILARLGREGLGSQPPVAYRALEFLTRIGFVHKIEKLNAYVACSHPGGAHAPAFMICRTCDSVAETAAQPGQGMLDKAAATAGFTIENTVLEAEGLCPDCSGKS
ncbi:Fur family transcriptional regulator [Meridianimarinicoccus roseus]|uniref:Fur family transcriptional regulator n=1 Tax=Meridianimarinicoccus roseus TaxID=2072018 RepID=A0A2V2LLJ2_9RHOB|nr:transcriptional repressor [Meridianimarinicoccus roseus]PWR02633.1 Fur family transcriptional regulator [Meridianimarinicoccus roseus]